MCIRDSLTTFPLKVFTQRNSAQQTFLKVNGHFAFLRTLWGLKATYTVHLRLTGKLVVDFLLVIIEMVHYV